ncbi:MAG: cobalt-precorrin-5B (C(1))-methyltransferase CbiD [Peptostreptococcaceae bacterium]|nr:cobalt-precorrin-5B (C(1))-methyltransferase CbiD [Peptostreptococcaceae bacterium]
MQQDEMVIVQGQKKLKRGYTTGTTATAAAKYSAYLMAESLGDVKIEKTFKDFAKEKEGEVFEYIAEIIPVRTVKGITVQVEIDSYRLEEYPDGRIGAHTTTVKESGDDPDVTHGAKISARLFFERKEKLFTQESTVEPKQTSAEGISKRSKIDPESIEPIEEEPRTDDRAPEKYLYALDLKDLSFEALEKDEAKGLDGDFGLVAIFGGEGVGFVTQKGLSPTKGHSAINPTPRQMILTELAEVFRQSEQLRELIRYHALLVEISVEGGAEIAKKTFNEKLGILGGISILGTSGIVEPMSEKALVDTIRTELDQFKTLDTGRPLLICPGNYGQAFARESLKLDLEKSVKISNFIGEALDYMVVLGIEEALLVGHAGKLLKLGASVMNTHSAYADGRQEVMASHSAICGASRPTLLQIMEAISIEEMLDALLQEGQEIFDETMRSIGKAMRKNIDHRTKGKIQIEFIVFTNSHGTVLQSDGAGELLSRLQEEE